MITTREINVNLDKGQPNFKRMTTKDVDASIKVKPPKEPVKTQSISTTTLPDVADIAEKKRRDDIMAERTNKPWNKMNAKERKEYQVEKAKKEKDEKKDKKD